MSKKQNITQNQANKNAYNDQSRKNNPYSNHESDQQNSHE